MYRSTISNNTNNNINNNNNPSASNEGVFHGSTFAASFRTSQQNQQRMNGNNTNNNNTNNNNNNFNNNNNNNNITGGGFRQISTNVIHNQQQQYQNGGNNNNNSSSSSSANNNNMYASSSTLSLSQQQAMMMQNNNNGGRNNNNNNRYNNNNNNNFNRNNNNVQQQYRQINQQNNWNNNNNQQQQQQQEFFSEDQVVPQEVVNVSTTNNSVEDHCGQQTDAAIDVSTDNVSNANSNQGGSNTNTNHSSQGDHQHHHQYQQHQHHQQQMPIPTVDAASTNREPGVHVTAANSHGNRTVLYDYVSAALPPLHHATHYHGGGARPLCCSSTQNYVMKEKLGQGTYGVVFRCEDVRTGASVAMKKIAEQRPEDGVPAIAIREIALLREVQHPNIVALHNVIPRERELLLIFEYVDQDLKKLLDSRVTPFQGLKLKWIMYQLLQGTAAMHAKRIVHRDLKPQNILVSKNEGVVKIADLGLARAFHINLHTYTKEVVTLWYRAPEILLGEKHYRPAIDVWSLGCIMAELATKRPMFPGDCEIHQLFLIFKTFGTPSEESWPGVSQLAQFNDAYPQWRPADLRNFVPSLDAHGLNLLKGLLQVDPMERISASAALQHPWFDEIRDAYSQQFAEYRKW